MLALQNLNNFMISLANDNIFHSTVTFLCDEKTALEISEVNEETPLITRDF